MKNLQIACLLLFLANFTFGQVSITNSSFTYLEDFNTLAITGTNNTTFPNGWALVETGSNGNTGYGTDNGSLTTGNTYSYGSTGQSDRAFGTLRSSNVSPTIGVQFQNNTTQTLASMTINYTGEQWRSGSTGAAVDILQFQYSTNATSLNTGTWTAVPALNFQSIVTTIVTALDGNDPANRLEDITATISGLGVLPGGTIWFRWVDFDVSGSDDGLAVEDFEITAITLPLEMTRFEARKAENSNELTWETATETNVSHFEIERSGDSKNWEKIGEIKAAGISHDPNNYEFSDKNPQPKSFYRLRSVDFDGKFSISNIVNIDRAGLQSGYIFPTTGASDFTVVVNSESENESDLRVFDAVGKIVFTQKLNLQKGENRFEFDFSNLPMGNYFAKINAESAPIRFAKN